ncbi:Csu type fimbrial protein [Novosphingobium mathurense]|uniref:Spore coat protein U (SCPU) domain-containing protein n=1 Tax=Novosphingobium mathurense TaxID=428990 RepID=A0A1U6I3S5_9SPHN|nr:spore coat U domain-containing protein [Novosphingobium mathurense]SLK02675.1 Spore coat protein U (SCPU) domain-containing protein [Novosphingobium mathurense]
MSIDALRPSRRIGLALFAFLFWFVVPNPARAACSAASGSVNLGSASSFTVAASAQTAGGATGFSCTGSLLSIASTNTITATIASATNSQGTQPRLHDAATGDYIRYDICKDSSCSATYAVGGSITWSSTTFLGILGLFNATGGTLPIHIRTQTGTQVAAGTYTGTISIDWTWHLCSAGAATLCIYDDGATSSTVIVSMTVSADCTLSAPTADFGSAAFVGSFDPVAQTITIRCSKDASYTVGIDDGQNYSGSRRLGNAGNYIAYEIYYPQGSTGRWGHLGTERRSSAEATTNAGTYTGTTDQTYTYRAEILSGQSTPPPGTYTDTLTIDVQF